MKKFCLFIPSLLLSFLALAACTSEKGPIEISGAEPPFLRQGSSRVEVTIRGSGFEEGAELEFLTKDGHKAEGLTVHSVRVVDSRTLQATVSADAQAPPGAFDIRVTLADRTGKGTELFGVVARQ